MKMPDFTDAACSEVGVDFFFPDSREQESEAVKTVIKICSTCPLYSKCLEYSLAVKVDGIWAGTTAQERRVIRIERGITATPIYSIHEVFISQSEEAKQKRKSRAKKSRKTQLRNCANA